MAKLSATQIRTAAAGAGFSGPDLDIAVAVAMAESGGNPNAHNAVPPDNSYGLWQINMLGGMGPERRKRYGLSSNSDLYNPSTNAKVAYGIFKGSGWKAWTTYTRGTYKKFTTAGGSTETAGSATPAPSTGSANPVLGIGDAINAFGKTIFNGIANTGGIIASMVFIVIGVVLLARNAIPVGKVLKIAGKVAK